MCLILCSNNINVQIVNSDYQAKIQQSPSSELYHVRSEIAPFPSNTSFHKVERDALACSPVKTFERRSLSSNIIKSKRIKSSSAASMSMDTG
mmetsp:Transcript_16054/g.24055  ORF Transcript_16054/g.24055 Transcript_16054/m.24055 type:complete len:92 (+) Transcript_16054:31-306(+)